MRSITLSNTGLACGIGCAQIAFAGVDDEIGITHQEGFIQPPLLFDQNTLLFRDRAVLGAQDQFHRIAGRYV